MVACKIFKTVNPEQTWLFINTVKHKQMWLPIAHFKLWTWKDMAAIDTLWIKIFSNTFAWLKIVPFWVPDFNWTLVLENTVDKKLKHWILAVACQQTTMWTDAEKDI